MSSTIESVLQESRVFQPPGPRQAGERPGHGGLLRSIARGEDISQDISTLENPAILEQLKKNQ